MILFVGDILLFINFILSGLSCSVSLRRSISKNTLEDEVLRTSTLRQSRIEKEVLSPVDEADDSPYY